MVGPQCFDAEPSGRSSPTNLLLLSFGQVRSRRRKPQSYRPCSIDRKPRSLWRTVTDLQLAVGETFMPQTPHIERHFTASEVVRDIVIGMSDGLTVPFALAAGLTGGLTGTSNPTGIIVTAGLAEIAAGSIAMGLGGYLAAKSDAEHYAKERERERREVAEIPEEEMREVAEVFHSYGLTGEETKPIVEALSKHPKKWVDFMMRF